MTCAPRQRERGFGMVEIIVVLVILAIMLGIGVLSVSSARKSGGRMLGVATARAYEQAIDRFAATHGGQVPKTNGVDWPTGAAAKDGPVAVIMGTRKRYLRTVPESVTDGRVAVGVGTPPAAGKAETTLTYFVDGSGYRIEVRTIGRPSCAVYGQGAKPGGSKPKAC